MEASSHKHETTLTPKEQALSNEIWDICNILFIAQENLRVMEFLMTDDENPDKNYIKKMNPYFRFASLMGWRLVVLELNKLFNRREHFNIQTFLGELKGPGKFGGIVDSDTVAVWEAKIADFSDIIERIRMQRNKSIAHKDRMGLDEAKNAIRLREVKDLVEVVQEIARHIYLKVHNASFLVDQPLYSPIESLTGIVDNLHKKHVSDMEVWKDLAKTYDLEDELPKL